MTTIRMTLTLEVTDEDPEMLARSLIEYVTSPESVLHEDYGPDAWGGYDGSKITNSHAMAEVEEEVNGSKKTTQYKAGAIWD